MRTRLTLAALACAAVLMTAGGPAAAQAPAITPVTDAMLQNPDPSDWLSWRRTLDGWGYSPLDQIDTSNGGGGAGGVRDRKYHFHPDSPDQVGELQALDMRTGETRWRQRRRTPYTTAALTTGAGLVFIGDWERHVFAYDAQSGVELWQARLPQMTNGFPITYAVDGTQYVAIGTGLSIGASSWATLIPAELLPEKKNPRAGGGIFVCALP